MSIIPSPPEAATIERLESATPDLAVSAVAALSRDAEKNRIRLKNAIRDVVQAVEAVQGENSAAELQQALERSAEALRTVQRPASWCLYTDGEQVETFLLPPAAHEIVITDNRYYVRPLLEAASRHGSFLLLALSQGDVQLYRLSGEQMQPLQLSELPRSLPDVVGHELDGGTLQQHTAGGSRFHGQGKGKDDVEPELQRFVRAVDSAIMDEERLRDEPLMLAAVDELAALYRAHSEHPRLLDTGVSLSPDQVRDDELHDAAREVFSDWGAADTAEFVKTLKEEHHKLTSSNLKEIVRAAEEGRVDTLVAVRQMQLWGRFDPENWEVEIHDERQENSRDLVDTVMRATWRQSGQVRLLDVEDPEQRPKQPLLARLRF